MLKTEQMDALLARNHGYMKTADVVGLGISKPYLAEYAKKNRLIRVAHGLYMSPDAWEDGLYVLQVKHPAAVFSHETALYLLNLAEREPLRYSVTFRAGTNASRLISQGVNVYKVREALLHEGLAEAESPSGHRLRVYNAERTLCDMIRSRKRVDIQDLQSAVKAYMRSKNKNLPLLMRYAKLFSVEQPVRRYTEVLLP